jgi:uncharacterized membrane protein YkvA (DUF1232 family)
MKEIQDSSTPLEDKPKSKDKYKYLKIIGIIAFAFFYDLSPIDFIPDIIPILGWGDDIFITVLSLIYAYKKNKS